MPRYRKKPVTINALQFNVGDASDVLDWIGSFDENRIAYYNQGSIFIETLEGLMEASAGDWIIRGVQGEFYPCKPDIFEETYERAE